MNFSITSKLNTQEYAKVMFIGLYKKPAFILSTILGLYFLLTVLLDHLHVIVFYDSIPLFEIICGLFLLLAPSLIVIISVHQFKSNPSFQNDTHYAFSENGIVIKGSTYTSEVSWAHIIKQKEIGDFLILYHSKKFGNFINKTILTENQLRFIKSKILNK